MEGPTGDESVSRLRQRMARNAMVLLLMSQGVPMILAGDERGRTQLGNNNAYCQDNETNWVDWRLDDQGRSLLRFVRLLIDFRKRHPGLRRRGYLETGPEGWPAFWWHGEQLNHADWSEESRALAMHLPKSARDADIYLIFNSHWDAKRFELPVLSGSRQWLRVVDTSLEAPDDIVEAGRETAIQERLYRVGPRSAVVLLGQ